MRKKPKSFVVFDTEPIYHPVMSETLWAFDLGNNRYRLCNIPFMLYGVSMSDIVFAPYAEEHACARFERVIIKSGNRTLRFVVDPEPDKARIHELLDTIHALGCGAEHSSGAFFALNVPAGVRLTRVTRWLERQGFEWEITDPDPMAD